MTYALTSKEKKRMAKRRKDSTKRIEDMYKSTKGQKAYMEGVWSTSAKNLKKVA